MPTNCQPRRSTPAIVDITVMAPTGPITEGVSTLIQRFSYQPVRKTIVSSVLPASRSFQLGVPATAFATIINAGNVVAEACRMQPVTPVDGTFAFQTTDPTTNALTGEANQPIDIAAGQKQSFMFSFVAATPFDPMDVVFDYLCSGDPAATVFRGVNTLLLAASAEPVADIVAVAATNPNTAPPQAVNPGGPGGSDFFAVATYNAGATASVDVTADTGTEDVPVSLSVCAGPADCFAGNQSLDGVAMPAAGTASFFVLVTANDYIDVRPGLNRVYVRFRTPDGVTRGSTSAAVASF
jgi:hypothetical protein